jgi:hypothetical protein
MNELRSSSFDWPTFGVRLFAILVLATVWLIERIRSHNRMGIILVIATGYVILPAGTYLLMRLGSRPRAGQ